MSLLIELLNEARGDVVQEDWDLTLISLFRAVKFPRMQEVIDNFRYRNKLSFEEFSRLKRIPKHPMHFRCGLRRFIAAYLPDLNTKLLDTDMTDEQLLAWMNRVNLDIQQLPADLHKVQSEARARRRANLLMQVDRTQKEQAKLNNLAHGRGWNTVKAVRSK